jgi:hypothetical protein
LEFADGDLSLSTLATIPALAMPPPGVERIPQTRKVVPMKAKMTNQRVKLKDFKFIRMLFNIRFLPPPISSYFTEVE